MVFNNIKNLQSNLFDMTTRFSNVDIDSVTVENYAESLPPSLTVQIIEFLPPFGSFDDGCLRRYLENLREYEEDVNSGMTLANRLRLAYKNLEPDTICGKFPQAELPLKRRLRCVAEYLIRSGEFEKLRDENGRLVKTWEPWQTCCYLQTATKDTRIACKTRTVGMNRREKLIKSVIGPEMDKTSAKVLDATLKLILGDMGQHYCTMWHHEGPGIMCFQPEDKKRSMFFMTLEELHSAEEKCEHENNGDLAETFRRILNAAQKLTHKKKLAI
jgi:hypothetical protein